MTIIEPNKNQFLANRWLYFVLAVVVGAAVLNILAYNRNVQLNHALKQELRTVDLTRAESSDLKNQLYLALDSDDIGHLASKLGLVKERKPEYIALQ
ncbi:MAG: hypothetical protein AAB389_04955 [Patescibacteria group bacterium]